MSLEEIEQRIHEANLPLKETATNLVFGKGTTNADILFIGEAPGEQEDLQGIPFFGRAGKELDALLQTIGLDINDVYIANILKYRPPKNRNPTTQEMLAHTPYLIQQITTIEPKILVPLGNFATKFVLNNMQVLGMNKISGISKLHGKKQQIQIEEKTWSVVPMYHPAAMLYNPRLRVVIQEDFQKVSKFLRTSSN